MQRAKVEMSSTVVVAGGVARCGWHLRLSGAEHPSILATYGWVREETRAIVADVPNGIAFGNDGRESAEIRRGSPYCWMR